MPKESNSKSASRYQESPVNRVQIVFSGLDSLPRFSFKTAVLLLHLVD